MGRAVLPLNGGSHFNGWSLSCQLLVNIISSFLVDTVTPCPWTVHIVVQGIRYIDAFPISPLPPRPTWYRQLRVISVDDPNDHY